MSPVHPFLPGVAEKVAAGAVMSLLKASALGIRRSLGKGEEEKALRAAVTEALTEALESQELNEEMSEHYAGLLAEFFAREEAAIELSQLLDPRPNQAPDLNTLAQEFRMAGYDPDRMSGFDLDSFLRSFFSAFYAAAGRQPSLQEGINLKLLGTQLQQLGIVAEATVRTAEAAERSADSLERLLQEYMKGKAEEQELRRRVDAALGGGFLQAYRMFEGFRIGLLSAGLDLGVNAQGVLEILGPVSESSSSARLETVRALAGELRGAVLDHTPSEEDLNALEARYRQHVIRWFGHLEFRGLMRTPKPIVLPLEEIYVELRAVAEVPEAADAFSVEERRLLLDMGEQDEPTRRELLSQLDAFRRERWSRTLPERKSMAEALHQRDRRAFVILGDPGSGKTTLLHFLALVYARGADIAARSLGVDAAEADRLPIFVPLAAFDDMLRESRREGGRSLTLQDFLPRYYDRRRGLPGLEPLFRRALESGRALVLLDGLDEVLDVTTRRYVAEQAGALIGEWSARGVRFALSSRFVGYREAPVPGNLPTLSVLDFGTPEIETFVRKWAFTFEKWVAQGEESPEMRQKAQVLEAGLLEDVRSNESVRRLAANPLMLTMLALLRRQVGRLPHRRVQLYESYVGTLLENWVDARSEGAREQSLSILDRHQAENILIPLAFWLQQEKPSGTAGRAEIRRKLVEICLVDRGIIPAQAERSTEKEAEEQADRFLREMRQMAGLLIERGHDAFGFLHLTFQEYFAGRALAQLGDQERWEAIRPHLHDPRWRESILLCAGRLGVVENRRPQVTQLVRDILGNEDPTEADLHRNLLLALAITCDDVNLEPTLISDLVERAISLLATPIDALARDLIRLLGQLVANGMVSFEACLPPIEQTRAYRKIIVIKELSRFAEVNDIGQWLRGQLDSGKKVIVAAALEALTSQMGEPSLWQKAIRKLASWDIGYAAACALTRVVKGNAEVRQRLLEAVGHGKMPSKIHALYALVDLIKIDAEVRKVFLSASHGSGGNIRFAAVYGLSFLASEDEEARRAVLAFARSRERYALFSVIDALTGLIGEDGEVRRIILDSLKDRDPEGRYPAVEVLSRILSSDQDALSEVMDLLEAEEVSSGLLASLTSCVPVVPEIHQVFLQNLAAQDWNARQVACQGLIDAGSASFEDLARVLHSRESMEAVAALESCAKFSASRTEDRWREFWSSRLEHPAPRHRSAAVIALAELACTSGDIRRSVLDRHRDPDFEVRRSALSALSGMVGVDAEVRRAALDRLKDKNSEVRQSALRALFGAVGADAEVRQAVLDRLKDKNSEVRQSALWALHGVVGADAEVRQAVLDRLKDKNSEVRQSALSALSGVVGADVEVRWAVLDRLKDKNSEVRQSALSALSGVVGADVEVRWAVLDRLKDKNSEVRQSALSALSGVVGTDAEVRRVVLDRLNDRDFYIRESALLAMSGVVGGDPEVRRMVLDRLNDEHYRVRQQAVYALAAVLPQPEVREAILQKLEDQDFLVRLPVVEVVARSEEEILLFESSRSRLAAWLGVDASGSYSYYRAPSWGSSVQAQLAKRFGAKLPTDHSLRDHLLKQLDEARWSSRLGAALALLAWRGGAPDEILTRVLAALEDRRGLEAYPAQLTAAAALINQNDYSAEAIDLCLEALDYGTQPWEHLYRSREIRKQAALVLGKLEPVFYDPRIYYKLLHVLHNDEDNDVRDAAYGTLVRLARIRDQQIC